MKSTIAHAANAAATPAPDHLFSIVLRYCIPSTPFPELQSHPETSAPCTERRNALLPFNLAPGLHCRGPGLFLLERGGSKSIRKRRRHLRPAVPSHHGRHLGRR